MLKGKWKSSLALAAVILLYLATMGITVILPAINAFEGWGAEKTAVFLIPLMFLLLIAVVVVSGIKLGRKYGYSSLARIACGLTLIGGCGSAWFAAYHVLAAGLVFRLLLAIGTGLMISFGKALADGQICVEQPELALGIAAVLLNVTGAVLSLLSAGTVYAGQIVCSVGLVLLLTALLAAMFLGEADRKAFASRALAWERAVQILCGCSAIGILMAANALIQTWFGVQGSVLSAGLLAGVPMIWMLSAGILTFAGMVFILAVAVWTNQRNMDLFTENTAEDCFRNTAWEENRKDIRIAETMSGREAAEARNGVCAAGGTSG